eukprot:GHVL01001543.1.p1 GENE.GHVL01001543.1~~GHVL01001543.1.p1  ORF type:complete len:136 (-),score=19.08 GHVL01001543.1:330-737(-)
MRQNPMKLEAHTAINPKEKCLAHTLRGKKVSDHSLPQLSSSSHKPYDEIRTHTVQHCTRLSECQHTEYPASPAQRLPVHHTLNPCVRGSHTDNTHNNGFDTDTGVMARGGHGGGVEGDETRRHSPDSPAREGSGG